MNSNKSNFWVLLFLLLIIVSGIWSFMALKVSENLDNSIPNKAAFQALKPILEKGKKNIIFSLQIEPNTPVFEIKQQVDSLVTVLETNTDNHLNQINYESDVDPDEFSTFFHNHLYLFLDSSDYHEIEQKLNIDSINQIMINNKKSLSTPEGIALKDWIIKDPLHFMSYGYNKFKLGALSEEMMHNEGLFISKNKRQVYVYAKLNYNSSNSQLNKTFESKLSELKSQWNTTHTDYQLDYFGTFLIANANAIQIEKDIKTTLTIAIILIVTLLFYYYRNVVMLVFFTLPALFGVLSAFLGMYLWQGSISGIALGAGAVVLGIVVDYSFHFFSQFKQSKNAFDTRKQIFLPLLVSGSTTIIAFLALTFAQSEVLHDFGLFAAFSLTGALFFVLVFLPSLLQPFESKINFENANQLDRWFDKIKIEPQGRAKWLVPIILLLSVAFYFAATDIQFESDLNKINYYPSNLKAAELKHQNIDPDFEKRINFLVEDATNNEAASQNQKLYQILDQNRAEYGITELNSLGLLLVSKEVQEQKINQWLQFWDAHKNLSSQLVLKTADSLGFNSSAFTPFTQWINDTPKTENLFDFITKSNSLSELLLPHSSIQNNYSIVTSLVIKKEKYQVLKDAFKNNKNAILVDGSGVMAALTEVVKDDFNYLLLFASSLVLVALLLIYGSVELTLVSFIPIALSWVWILGIAALLDFKFNFVNIILITFIFGLGDDFAIFITDGLQTKYKFGRKVLGHYKAGIVLSSASTIIGTGVLIFAKHPAIKSIAGISVTGILTIVFISFFVQPLLFHFFITRRTNEGKPPVTILGIIISIIGYSVFILGSLTAVISGLIIRSIPGASTSWKKRTIHKMLQGTTGFMLDFLFTTTKRYYHMENLDFSKPSIIIANHASFFDILALARLNPNMVMMVNSWVYNSGLFGNLVRYADFIPTTMSMEENLPKIRELTNKGYSIAIFPEGRRSVDGKIGRFHKGAFLLAEKLKMDITPIILHGYAYTMPKYDYNLKNSYLSTYVLPRIKHDDNRFGNTYKERAKQIGAYFKEEYKMVADTCGALDYQYVPLLFSYKYKGPILEWYFRIKWKFEKQHYENYYQLIGNGKKRIYDLGCGYGFLSHFLKLRAEEFEVFGFDYDEDKVAVAQNSYLKSDGIEFAHADISTVQPKNANVVIIADTLHYLTEDKQIQTLKNVDKGLLPGGVLLIRDGLSDLGNSHEWTQNSEKWSTRIMKFNKVKNDLHFFSKTFIENWAAKNGYHISFDMQSENSSNTLMILRKE